MKIIHLSDIHLNFCQLSTDSGRLTRKKFAKSLNDAASIGCKCIILTGDISETPYLIDDLYWLSQNFTKNIYFVLGNHDFYYGSFSLGNQCAEIAESLTKKVIAGTSKINNLFYLQNKDPIDLGENTFLVGVNGWYDLRNFNNIYSDFQSFRNMNDFETILPLREMVESQSSIEELISFVQILADNETKILCEKLDNCLNQSPEIIIIATHVPPLSFSKDEYTGFYSNKKLMERLLDYSTSNPNTQFTVLTGHNHAGGFENIDNLTIYCKQSRYSNPNIEIVET